MQRTDLAKALSITLLLSCATHVHAMSRKKNKELMQQKQQAKNAAPQAAAAADEKKQAGLNIGDSQEWPDLNQKPATTPEPKDESSEETKQEETAAQEVSTAVAALIVATKSEEAQASKASEVVASMEKIAENKEVAEPAKAKKTLLGEGIKELLKMDDQQLVQKAFWGKTNATVPHAEEGRLLDALKSNNLTYLQDIIAEQHLNRVLNHLCAGIIQDLKVNVSVNNGSNIETNPEQIESFLTSQFPRAQTLAHILNLCEAYAKKNPTTDFLPSEKVKKLAQTCFKVILDMQLERKLIRGQEENDRIRQMKKAQCQVHSMRLKDKGSISDDEYDDLFIFEKTTL